MAGAVVYRFGPFELDAVRSRLYKSGKLLSVSLPQLEVLAALVVKAGDVVPKKALLDAGWPGTAIEPNNLEQVISRLRKLLGRHDDGIPFIETVTGEGYRFVAPVSRGERHDRNAPLDEQLAPYRAFVQGRAALDTLDRAAILTARNVFIEILKEAPDYAPALVGLANACSLLFESMRDDAQPDHTLLTTAIDAAQRACAREPAWAEAWSTLAFALYQHGDTVEAAAAACKAIDQDGDDWRHALRLAIVSPGEECLRAARRTLALCPELTLAYWLMTRVFTARGAIDAGFDVVRKGCAAEDAQVHRRARFPGLGLHLQHALLLGATGNITAAFEELRCELDCLADLRHIYARECAANTWYTLGAFQRRAGRHREAEASFGHAVTIIPKHLFAAAALGTMSPHDGLRRWDACSIDGDIAVAIGLAREGRHADAARICADALLAAPPGHAGWIIPVEPLLNVSAHPDVWAQVLSIVRDRAPDRSFRTFQATLQDFPLSLRR